MAEFTPRDEIGDWAIASGLELVKARLDDRPLAPLINAPQDRQAMWELLVTVARSVGSILRPEGRGFYELGPIGHQSPRVAAAIRPLTVSGSAPVVVALVVPAGQLIGCAASDDFPMVRALAAALLSDDGGMDRARLVLRAMLEILATEPVDPPTQEPS